MLRKALNFLLSLHPSTSSQVAIPSLPEHSPISPSRAGYGSTSRTHYSAPSKYSINNTPRSLLYMPGTTPPQLFTTSPSIFSEHDRWRSSLVNNVCSVYTCVLFLFIQLLYYVVVFLLWTVMQANCMLKNATLDYTSLASLCEAWMERGSYLDVVACYEWSWVCSSSSILIPFSRKPFASVLPAVSKFDDSYSIH